MHGESYQCPGTDVKMSPLPLSVQNLTVSNTAVKLTVPKEALMAVIAFEDQPVRFTLDGTAPTTTVGALVFAVNTTNVVRVLCGREMAELQLIRTGTDAKVSVTYYGVRGNP